MSFPSIFVQLLLLIFSAQTEDTHTKGEIKLKNINEAINDEQGDIKPMDSVNDDELLHLKTETSDITSLPNNNNAYEILRYDESCFCPLNIVKCIQSREKYMKGLKTKALGDVYNIDNNIYYIIYRTQSYYIFVDDETVKCPIIGIKLRENSSYDVKMRNKNVELVIKKMEDQVIVEREYDLLTDKKIMNIYFLEIRNFLFVMIDQLFGRIESERSGRIIFENIRNSQSYKFFYRVLKEINIISIKNDNKIVRNYYEKAIGVYRSYIVGIELLGKTLERYECLLSNSEINIGYSNDKLEPESTNVIIYTKDKKVVEGQLESEPSLSDNMLEIYYAFCERLAMLDANLKYKCLREQDWDINMSDIKNVCDEIIIILNKLLEKAEKTSFYEGKCTLLRVIVELWDCIYQSINMKRRCELGLLFFDSYGGQKLPEFTDKEKSCQGRVKAELFLSALDIIKSNITGTVLNNRGAFSIEDILKTLSEQKNPTLMTKDCSSTKMDIEKQDITCEAGSQNE